MPHGFDGEVDFDQSAASERMADATLPRDQWSAWKDACHCLCFKFARLEGSGSVSFDPYLGVTDFGGDPAERIPETGSVRLIGGHMEHLIGQILMADPEAGGYEAPGSDRTHIRRPDTSGRDIRRTTWL